MKQIKCKSCGALISKQAKTCPKCGHPNKQTSVVTWAVGILFAFILFNSFFLNNNSSNKSTYKPPAKVEPVKDKSPAAQKKREQLIQKLINTNIFKKVDVPGSLPHVHVGDEFMNLSFDEKQSFTGVVFAYYYTIDQNADIVVIKDFRTNEEIGKLTQRGLDLKN